MITDLRSFIMAVLVEMEGSRKPGKSPFQASFAGVANSGLSFGELQHDVGQNDANVLATFKWITRAAGEP